MLDRRCRSKAYKGEYDCYTSKHDTPSNRRCMFAATAKCLKDEERFTVAAVEIRQTGGFQPAPAYFRSGSANTYSAFP